MTIPVSQPERVLARILDTSQPDTLLYCGDTASRVSEVWHGQRKAVRLLALDTADPNARLPLDSVPDLAIITDTLEHLPYEEGALLLGQLRNYGTHQIAVLVPQTTDWGFTDFIALGFQRHADIESENGALTLYTYNLDTYNHKRAWNNPDNWANPEMWGKAWW
ncbi:MULTISPECIES: DUF6231 family protein [Marinobacter]|jgi:hypothetical protein|uniref:DUF6231 family protein n=1 Tax=Marinobacter TaxID=2742 RepID=UPI000EAE7B55|nr:MULTISPECIES: DUF6231 family protein [Marinobacter]MEC9387411.1 DUF6231 family protein [Pseudomonadota bacterium]MBW3197916.1 hypothetical protein [Marinobacter nauticus]MBY6183326.1 hypothetical protein [Marinobacter nauticus]MCC4271475.1 DUF6231 family protein [Marinobacter nauticus]MCW9011543.1 DUF6231 family protein [Marinobacter sp.]